jgi:hypothetical protein
MECIQTRILRCVSTIEHLISFFLKYLVVNATLFEFYFYLIQKYIISLVVSGIYVDWKLACSDKFCVQVKVSGGNGNRQCGH